LRQAVVARTGSGRYLAPKAGSARARTAGALPVSVARARMAPGSAGVSM
jgi:hypothetical protein